MWNNFTPANPSFDRANNKWTSNQTVLVSVLERIFKHVLASVRIKLSCSSGIDATYLWFTSIRVYWKIIFFQYLICLGSKKQNSNQMARTVTEMAPKIAQTPLKVKKKFFQSSLCGYSKPVSFDAWCNEKDEKLILSSLAEKMPQNCQKITTYIWFCPVFNSFLDVF